MTTNQNKGWFGEIMAKVKSMVNGNSVSTEKPNNKGFDFVETNVFTGEKRFVESKTNSARLTKAQREKRDECEDDFVEERTDTYDLFEDFDDSTSDNLVEENTGGKYSNDDFSNDFIGVSYNNDPNSLFYGLPD